MATLDLASAHGQTSLMDASVREHVAVVTALCEAGASVDAVDGEGQTAFARACIRGNTECAKALSSFGASRSLYRIHVAGGETAEEVATHRGHTDLAAWLTSSRKWSTPLHHLTIITAARARALLRGGADLRAARQPGGPTPLSLAEKLRTAGDAPEGSAAHLVLCASRRWSPQTHELFPAVAREHAVAVLLAGHLLARKPRFEGVAGALLDVWVANVLPHAVTRG
jgi:hypothetical protein